MPTRKKNTKFCFLNMDAFLNERGGPVFPPKRGLVAGRASDRKRQMPCIFFLFFLLEGIHIQLLRNQMLAVMVLSQHRVSTSKTVSPRIAVGARCTGHVRIMCSAVCSAAPHSQFDVGARPHLCMND